MVGSLGSAALEATAFTLIGLGLFHARRRFGMIPFLFLFAVLAGAVPSILHLASTDVAGLGELARSHAVVVPVLIAFVLLLHLVQGWRNAQIAAGMFLFAGVLVSVSVLAAHSVSALSGDLFEGLSATTPLLAMAVLWLAALAASGLLIGLYRIAPQFPVVPAMLVGGLTGLGAHGLLVYALGLVGISFPFSSGLAPVVAPLATGLFPLTVVGVYAAFQLAGLWPETRQQLISNAPLGSDSPLNEALDRQARYELAREQGRKEGEAYKELIEADEHGAYICDKGGRITYANTALGRILEQPDSNLVGDNVAHLFGRYDEQGHPLFARWAIKPGSHCSRISLPDGHERVVEVTVRPAGKERFYGRVRDRTEEMLRAQVEEQKERAEFYVELLRHDIGNYVTTPLNYLTLLSRQDDLSEDAERWVEASEAAVREIADLLRRVDVISGVGDLTPEPIDAGEVMASVADRFQRKHPSLGITLDLPDQPVTVQGTPLLEEVFVNLVGNAVRHAGTEAQLTLGASPEDGAWVLRVDDDGPGVPDALKDKVFERSMRDESAGGKGLGLHIVRTIVGALGAEVWVTDRIEDDPSQGASFRVRLTAAEALEPSSDGLASSPGSDTATA